MTIVDFAVDFAVDLTANPCGLSPGPNGGLFENEHGRRCFAPLNLLRFATNVRAQTSP